MKKAVRAKDLTLSATGLRGRFLCYKIVTTNHGPTKIFTFATENGDVTIWNNRRLDVPMSEIKRGDDVVIVWDGTETLDNGHAVEDYKVFRLVM
jgi:hypothetical protein